MTERSSSPSPSPPVTLDHVPLALQDIIRSYLPATTDVSGTPHPENHHVEVVAHRDLGYFFRSGKPRSLQFKIMRALAIVVGSILVVLVWKAQWWLMLWLHATAADGADGMRASHWTPVNFFRPVQLFYCALFACMLVVDWIGYWSVWRMHRRIYSMLTVFRNPYAPHRCLVYNADLDAVAEANAKRRVSSSSMWAAGSIACAYFLPQACQLLWSYFFMWPLVLEQIALRGAPDNGRSQWSSALSAPGVRDWLLPQSLICDPAFDDPRWSAYLRPVWAYLSLWPWWPRMSITVFWRTLRNPRTMLWGFQAVLYLATTVAMLAASTFLCLMYGTKGFGGRGKTRRRAAPEHIPQDDLDEAEAAMVHADEPPLLLMPGAAEAALQQQQQQQFLAAH